MFEAIKFPASIADLNTGLTNVNGYAFPHLSLFLMICFFCRINEEALYEDFRRSPELECFALLCSAPPLLGFYGDIINKWRDTHHWVFLEKNISVYIETNSYYLWFLFISINKFIFFKYLKNLGKIDQQERIF